MVTHGNSWHNKYQNAKKAFCRCKTYVDCRTLARTIGGSALPFWVSCFASVEVSLSAQEILQYIHRDFASVLRVVQSEPPHLHEPPQRGIFKTGWDILPSYKCILCFALIFNYNLCVFFTRENSWYETEKRRVPLKLNVIILVNFCLEQYVYIKVRIYIYSGEIYIWNEISKDLKRGLSLLNVKNDEKTF